MSTTIASNQSFDIPDPRGGRNRVRRGDPVKVTAGPVDLSGFRAVFCWATLDDAGDVYEITVFGGRGFDPVLHAAGKLQPKAVARYRTFRPDRIRRMARANVARAAADQ